MKIIFMMLAALFLAGCNSIWSNSDSDVYKVHYTDTPIKIDGKLDEAIWAKAKPLTLSAHPESLYTEKGVAKIVWDDKYVYFSGVLDDSDIIQIESKDWRHFYRTGDTFEMFLKPVNQRYYWELYATPNSLKCSLFFLSGGSLWFYSRTSSSKMKQMLVTSTCDGTLNNKKDYDKKWITEVAIPIKYLERHGEKIIPGKVWKFLIGRYNYGIHLDRKELSRTGNPKSKDFHDSRYWSKMKFVRTH